MVENKRVAREPVIERGREYTIVRIEYSNDYQWLKSWLLAAIKIMRKGINVRTCACHLLLSHRPDRCLCCQPCPNVSDYPGGILYAVAADSPRGRGMCSLSYLEKWESMQMSGVRTSWLRKSFAAEFLLCSVCLSVCCVEFVCVLCRIYLCVV